MVDPLTLGLRWRPLLRGQQLAQQWDLLNESVETVVLDTSLYEDLTQEEYASAIRAAIEQEICETRPQPGGKRNTLEKRLQNWMPENYAETLLDPTRLEYQGVQQYRKRFEEQEEIRQCNKHLEILAEILAEMPTIKEFRIEGVVKQRKCNHGPKRKGISYCLDRSTQGSFDHEVIGLTAQSLVLLPLLLQYKIQPP